MAVEAALGAIFGELLKAVLETADKIVMFRRSMADLRKILTAIGPVIKDLEQQNRELGRPKQELESLIRDMKQGTELVYKCSKIKRTDIIRRLEYQEQLEELTESIEKFFNIDLQAHMARDMKEALNKLNRIESTINKNPHLRGSGSSSSSIPVEVDHESVKIDHDSEEMVIDDDQMEEFKEAFRVFDRDQDGYISAAELRNVMNSIGIVTTMEEIHDMIREVDADGDNQIDFPEFIIFMIKTMGQ